MRYNSLSPKDIDCFFNLAFESYWEIKDVLTEMWFDERDDKPINIGLKVSLETELARRDKIWDSVDAYMEKHCPPLGINQGPR